VYHTHQYQKQNYMLDLGSYVLATKNIYHVMHISHALEGKKNQRHKFNLHLYTNCAFFCHCYLKKTQMKDPNLRSQKGLAFPFHGCFYQ
jgi:hypothetical protein